MSYNWKAKRLLWKISHTWYVDQYTLTLSPSTVAFVRSRLNMFFWVYIIIIPKYNFLDYFNKVIFPDVFEAFLPSRIFNNTLFCSRKNGILLMMSAAWYNRMGDFLLSILERRKEILCSNGSASGISETKPTPECKVSSTECYGSWVWTIYLFTCTYIV